MQRPWCYLGILPKRIFFTASYVVMFCFPRKMLPRQLAHYLFVLAVNHTNLKTDINPGFGIKPFALICLLI